MSFVVMWEDKKTSLLENSYGQCSWQRAITSLCLRSCAGHWAVQRDKHLVKGSRGDGGKQQSERHARHVVLHVAAADGVSVQQGQRWMKSWLCCSQTKKQKLEEERKGSVFPQQELRCHFGFHSSIQSKQKQSSRMPNKLQVSQAFLYLFCFLH